MTVGDRAAQHVEFTLIDFASGMSASQHIARETLACEQLYVCQGLRGKRFVHINQG
ncbi:Uncharacterised protein [Enterobacter asburiae]|uniref:Uncharacterized protein n=1 Tax=Enterobacter asburiae TaxID=61645 RepID=A0A376FLP8_ENTAS|nr:Uncharacterised protein [Enterobacter asburiae]